MHHLDPRPFRAGRDGLVAAGLVVVVAVCIVVAVVTGHAAAVLGAVYAAMVLLVWIEAFRSSWAIGPDVLSARRWLGWRTVRADDVTTVAMVPGEPGVDLSIDGRVVVPLDDWRPRPGAVDHLRQFMARAEAAGARVEPAVWRALDRA